MTFGAKLRTARLDQRRTLADVAEQAGMSTQRLCDIETSVSPKTSTSAKNVVALADALGLDRMKLLRLAKREDFAVWKRAFASVKCDRRQAALDRYEQQANALARSYAPEIYPCAKCGYPVASGYCCGSCKTDEPGGGN